MDGNMHEAFKPPVPLKLSELGLEMTLMIGILLKTIFRRNLSDIIDIAEALSISVPIAQELVDEIRAGGMIETLGARGASTTATMRYQLTESGRARALDALQQSEYYGSFPVPLADFWKQTERQKVKDVNIRREDLENSLSHLVMPEGMLDQLGPAVNSGKSVLLFGPPGNGKSSISNGIRDALGDNIFLPRFLEYAGQVISLYDPIIHTLAKTEEFDTSALRRLGAKLRSTLRAVSPPIRYDRW